MANQRFPVVRGRVMRVTRLDGCGRRQPGPCSAIITDGFVSVALTAVIQEAETITLQNAAGRTCVSDAGVASFNGYNVTTTFCNVDPELFAMMSGQTPVYNGDGDAVGFRVNSDVDASDTGFALEVWSNVPSVQCAPGGSSADGSYGYTLLPFLSGGVLGDFTIENNAVTFTIQNASTKTGSAWGVGPYNVVLNGSDVPSPLLEPIETGDHLHVQVTNVAPPEPSDACIPSGPAATGATAGVPGTFTPVNSYPPVDFADLTNGSPVVVASPNTAWTTGQRVVLGDGSLAHWSGSAWVVGAKP